MATITRRIQQITQPASSTQENIAPVLCVFDSRVPDLEILYGALVPGAIAHTIDAQADALTVITQLLAQTGATRLAIVAHGEPGVVYIGATPITQAQLQARASLLQEWCVEEIALYSCEVGADSAFVANLEHLTGAQIASSTEKVGSANHGGSWHLIQQIAAPIFKLASIESYQYTLALSNISISGVSGTDTFFNASEAQSVIISGTIDQNTTSGEDVLIGIYASSGALLYWLTVNGTTSFSTTLNLKPALGSYEGDITFRFWQGTDKDSINGNSGVYTGTTKILPPKGIFGYSTNGLGGGAGDDPAINNANLALTGYTLDTVAPTKTTSITAVTDNVGPVTGTVPHNGSTDDTTPTLSGTISGTLATGEVVAIYRTVGGVTTKIGTATVSGTSWDYTDSGLVNGTAYQYTARIEDAAGNRGSVSATYTIAIDTVAPLAPTVALVNDTGADSGDRITKDSSLSITAETGASIEYSIDGGESWLSSFTPVEGQNTFLVRQIDRAGNISEATPYSFILDTIANAPDVALLYDTGSSSSDKITRNAALSVTGLEDGTTVEYKIGEQEWTSSYIQPAGDGEYTVQVRQTDLAGNSSIGSISFTLDTTAPSTPTIEPIANDNIIDVAEAAAGVVIRGTTDSGTSVILSFNGERRDAEVSGTNWSYTLTSDDWVALGQGPKTLWVASRDVAGNRSALTRGFVVDTLPLNAPSVSNVTDNSGSITGSIANGNSTDDTTPTFVINLFGTNAAAGDTLRLFNGSTEIATQVLAKANITAGSISVTPTALEEGVYFISAKITDAAGNQSDFSEVRELTIDTTPPAAPTINQVAGDDIVNRAERNAGVTVSGTAEANSIVNLKWGNTTLTTTADVDGNWSSDFSTAQILANGNTTITATVRDAVGNPSTAARSVLIDTIAPTVPTINQVAEDDRVNNAEKTATGGVTVSGVGEANSIVNVAWGSGNTLATTVDANGNWSTTFYGDKIPADGKTTIIATATDAVGNISGARTRSVLVDTIANAPGLALVTDSGSSAADRITNSGVVRVTGLESGAIWQYSTDEGANWINGEGTNFTLTGDGGKRVLVRQTDLAGNASTSTPNPFIFTLDTVAPTAPTISGFRNVSGSMLAVAGLAEAGSRVAVFRDDISLGTVRLGTVVANGDGSWSFNTTGITNGSFNISAIATDVAGNASVSSAVSNIITGSSDNNILEGTTNNDVLAGYAGNDDLKGGAGNDTLWGGDGNDILNGGDGDDVLVGGRGNDTLTGGAGSDQFVYQALTDRGSIGDTITDFSINEDQLVLIDLFRSLNYSGSDPLADGYLRYTSVGANTQVQIDLDGPTGVSNFVTLVTLNDINKESLVIGTNVLI